MKRLGYYLLLFLCLSIIFSANSCADDEGFSFMVWSDAQGQSLKVCSALSDAMTEQPVTFTLFAGDLEQAGFTPEGIARWRRAIDGELTGTRRSNGMSEKTFTVRGNHDAADSLAWQGYFDMAQVARAVGARNHRSMEGKENLVYSFDYQNTHFVALDNFNDGASLSDAQISWLDADLAAATVRGCEHTFLFCHAPFYGVGVHARYSIRVSGVAEMPDTLMRVINKYPFVRASFHGHEHIYSMVYLDDSRLPGLDEEFYQFVAPSCSAYARACTKPERSDSCLRLRGCLLVTVNGEDIQVDLIDADDMTVRHTVMVGAEAGIHKKQRSDK